MKLSVGDRLTLFGILPENGSYETSKTILNTKQALLPSEDEVKKFGIRSEITPESTITRWEKNEEAEIEIGDLVIGVIKTAFTDMPAVQWTGNICLLAESLIRESVLDKEVMVKALKQLDVDGKIKPEHHIFYERYVVKAKTN